MEPKGLPAKRATDQVRHPRAPQDTKHNERPYKSQKTSKKVIPRPQNSIKIIPESVSFHKKAIQSQSQS